METFHTLSRKHLDVPEFDFRWDSRKIDDGELLAPAIRSAEGKRYREPDASADSGPRQAILKVTSQRKRRDEKPFVPNEPKYEPLASVWHGEDAELLENLLNFYPRKRPKKILDATVNGRRFWRDSKRPVLGLDIEPKHKPDVAADNTLMPFRPGSFDVVVYDPPHIPNQGKDRSKDFNTRFGLGLHVPKEQGYNFSHTFPPFMREAWRILKSEGILLCKITDYIHHHRYQWAHVELIQAAQTAGFRACDCIWRAPRKLSRNEVESVA